MTVTLKIVIECGENVCNTSAHKSCGYMTRLHVSISHCQLFNTSLQGGKYKHDSSSSYKEYTRCKECKEAEIHEAID